jgi:beta-galactosidase
MYGSSFDGEEEIAPLNPRLPALYFGADYNPEQWMLASGEPDEHIWREDLRLMKLAGVNVVTLAVFSWGQLQTDEETFTFSWLDRVMDMLREQEIFVCLGTSTAALPAWLASAYPDVLPVDAQGVRRGFGQRQNYCPTSPDFHRLARKLVQQLAGRYKDHPALLTWHVSNEYYGGATDRGYPCHCSRCQQRFRHWLRERYGSLDALNRAWVTAFWSHTYTSWEQICIPGPQTEMSVQGQVLDFARFTSDVYLQCYQNELEVLRELTPDIPVTTNMMGAFKALDLFSWAAALDVISWDAYPRPGDHPASIAFQHDLMRGLKQGKPFLLMEQTPSQVQWHPQNPLKRPGVMRLLSYQAIGHGADAIQFFQWRQSRGSGEMFHGAIVSHAGHANTRVFREVAHLGRELHELSQTAEGRDLPGSRVPARVALVFSWPNWWNVEFLPGPSNQINYLDEVLLYYRSLWKKHVAVDIVPPDADLTAYELVIAPLLNMVSAQQGQRIEQFVTQGGVFVTSYFSGIVNENAQAWQGGYPGPLRKTLGIQVEEFDPLEPGTTNSVIVPEGTRLPAGAYPCQRWCDLLHLEGAQALAHFGDDFYAGFPAATEHHLGQGRAFYIATRPDEQFLDALVELWCSDLALAGPFPPHEAVEIIQRQHPRRSFTFLLNHASTPVDLQLPRPMYELLSATTVEQQIHLPAKGVAILSEARRTSFAPSAQT